MSIEFSERFENFMCDVCQRTPCHPRCPNSPDPPQVFICSGCGGSIVDGEDYWDVLGEQWCENCIREAQRTAEYIPEEAVI